MKIGITAKIWLEPRAFTIRVHTDSRSRSGSAQRQVERMPSDAIGPFQAMEGKGMGGRVRVSPVVVAQGCHGSRARISWALRRGPQLCHGAVGTG
jgi:hypothetical protein